MASSYPTSKDNLSATNPTATMPMTVHAEMFHSAERSAIDAIQNYLGTTGVPGPAFGAYGYLPTASGATPTNSVVTVGKESLNANQNSVASIAADGTTDDGTAWNSILNSITAPGVDIFFEGTSVMSTMPSWKTGVGLHGKGWGKSVLKPMSGLTTAPIQLGGSLANQIKDVRFKDFEIDGSALSGATPVKGFFMTYLKRARFEGVYVHDVTATCFGNDFGDEVWYLNCLAENAGRGQLSTALGCSGFGWGAGAQAVEVVKAIGCVSRGAKRSGFLIEYQTGLSTVFAEGYELTGCHAEANQFGFAENGGQYTRIVGCKALSNTSHGIWVAQGNNGAIGVGTFIHDCEARSNGGRGILLDESSDGTAPPFYGRYSVRGNRVRDNISVGIKASWTALQTEVIIEGNEVYNNGSIGIDVSGGSMTDSSVSNNEVRNNTGQGIRIFTTATRTKVRGNASGNVSGTSQTYGLELSSGVTLTDCSIQDNDLRNNATGPLNNVATLAGTTFIKSNPGYNPVGLSTVSVGASPYTYTCGVSPTTLFVIGGTYTSITINGTSVVTGSPADVSLPLQPGDSVVFTYTGAPTAVKQYIT